MILASKSPRRKEILESFGFEELEIKVADIEEISDKEDIYEQIEDIAYKKALAISKDYPNKNIVAADTVVIIDNKLLGKPNSIDEAKEMLNMLSGREHKVVTAFAFINENKKIRLKSYEKTLVKFKKLNYDEIEWYIYTKEPFDKAGAYGIQGKGAVLVEKINGDFFNVMGFPISKFYTVLKENGVSIREIKSL